MSIDIDKSTDPRDILYVGGPLSGKYMQYDPKIKWPPRIKSCISDIPVGRPIGIYVLRGSTLEWKVTRPTRYKTDLE